jgi:hypothetical protein
MRVDEATPSKARCKIAGVSAAIRGIQQHGKRGETPLVAFFNLSALL